MMRVIGYIICLFLCVVAQASYAASTEWQKTEEVSMRLLAGERTSDGEQLLALEFKMAKGWKTYWRTPGDAGFPAEIDWSPSDNIKSLEIVWPAPTRFVDFGALETLGYKDHLLLPIRLIPLDKNRPITADFSVHYAVCDEVCIFLDQQVSLTIPASHSASEIHSRISHAIASAPESQDHTISFSATADDATLDITATSNTAFNHPDILVELSDNFRFPRPTVTLSDDKKTAYFSVPYETLLEGKTLTGETARFTLVDGERAAEQSVLISATTSIMWIIAAAFLGGLILNIMPCVLPVLSLKVMGVVKHRDSDLSDIRLSFLMSTAGILVSFLLLAGLVIGLKSAGHAVGWGFHFQEPVFLIFLVIIISLFAANQWELFEFRLPSWLGGTLYGATSGNENTKLGHFLTGAFATLLATPCSAPFLGTAISFALSRSEYDILFIFLVMGLGLSLPYLLFALQPKLVQLLPRSGQWMVMVKQTLGLLLWGTAVWLLWVLFGQLGLGSALSLAGMMIVMIIYLHFAHKGTIRHGLLKALIFITIITTSFALPLKNRADHSDIQPDEVWEIFNEKRIPELVKEGKTVFVDVTADWCLTCKFNKFNVLYRADVLEQLNRPDVIAMKADLTSPNPQIVAYLRRYNRYAIPFNIVYGPGAPEGILLSELLSTSEVLEALKTASTP